MFAVWFLTSWTLMTGYVAWRALRLPAVAARRGATRWGWAATLALATTLPLARVLRDRGPEWLATPLEWVGSTWLGVVFLTTCCLLLSDLVTCFGLALRPHVPRLRAVALATGAVLAIVASVQGLRPPVVTSVEVHLPGLPADRDGTVLVAMSDLHLGRLIDEDWLSARVDEVNALRPDAIVLLGDVLDGSHVVRHEDRFAPVLARLSAPLGVFAVLGNHEAHAGLEVAQRLLERAGARVLREGFVEAAPGLVFAGVTDRRFHHVETEEPGRVGRALAGRPQPAGTVLLSHRPGMEQALAAASGGAGLMLSGHTHAGQVWPFSLVAAQFHYLFDGRYEVLGTTVVVTRGTGTWGPRMRLWRRGEILRVTLRASNPAS